MFNYGLCGRAFGLVRVSWPPHPGDTACTAECVGFVAFLCECFTVSICKDQVFMDIQSNVQVCVHVMEGMGRGGGGGGGRSVLSLHSDVNFTCGLCWTLIQRVGFFFLSSCFMFRRSAMESMSMVTFTPVIFPVHLFHTPPFHSTSPSSVVSAL